MTLVIPIIPKRIPDDGVAGDGNHQFRNPAAIAVHPLTGRVYVADTYNHRIKALDADLNFIRQLPAHGVVPGDGNNQFRFPKGIAINTVTGRVYVADTDNHRIKVLDEDLNILSHYKNDQFDRPHDISLAMVGNNVQLRVTDFPNNQHRTQIFTVDGIVRTIGDGRNGQRQVSLPTSVAVDLPKPFIVLVNRHNGIVKKVYFTQQKTIRGENFQLNTPEGIAVHPVTGSACVCC